MYYSLLCLCVPTKRFHGPDSLQRVFQEGILEPKVRFDSLTPAGLVVKVHVRALLVLVRRDLGLFVPLEPRHVLLMVPPALFLELSSCKILLIGTLRIVKDKEQTIGTELFKDGGVIKDR